jgi:outer membrane immunogenic protein
MTDFCRVLPDCHGLSCFQVLKFQRGIFQTGGGLGAVMKRLLLGSVALVATGLMSLSPIKAIAASSNDENSLDALKKEIVRLREENAALRKRVLRRDSVRPDTVAPPPSVGHAADIGAAPVYKTPPPVPPVFSWTGFYVGGSAGYGWSSDRIGLSTIATNTFNDPTLDVGPELAGAAAAAIPQSVKTDPHGFIGGGQIGWNWQGSDTRSGSAKATGLAGAFDNLIVVQGSATAEQKLDWLGTVRGRLGFALTDRFLIYGTAGLAYGHISSSASISETSCITIAVPPSARLFTGCSTDQAAGSLSQVRTGWAAGGGLEYALAPNWTVKTEYLHWDLGDLSYNFGLNSTVLTPAPPLGLLRESTAVRTTAVAHFRGDIVRLGINYRFDWGGGLVAVR